MKLQWGNRLYTPITRTRVETRGSVTLQKTRARYTLRGPAGDAGRVSCRHSNHADSYHASYAWWCTACGHKAGVSGCAGGGPGTRLLRGPAVS